MPPKAFSTPVRASKLEVPSFVPLFAAVPCARLRACLCLCPFSLMIPFTFLVAEIALLCMDVLHSARCQQEARQLLLSLSAQDKDAVWQVGVPCRRFPPLRPGTDYDREEGVASAALLLEGSP